MPKIHPTYSPRRGEDGGKRRRDQMRRQREKIVEEIRPYAALLDVVLEVGQDAIVMIDKHDSSQDIWHRRRTATLAMTAHDLRADVQYFFHNRGR